MTAHRRTKKPSLGILFWIAILLLTLAIFLSNRRNIQQALERSGLRQIIAERSAEKSNDVIEIVEEPATENIAKPPSKELPIIVAPS